MKTMAEQRGRRIASEDALPLGTEETLRKQNENKREQGPSSRGRRTVSEGAVPLGNEEIFRKHKNK